MHLGAIDREQSGGREGNLLIKADSRKVGWPRRPRCLLWFNANLSYQMETPVGMAQGHILVE